MKLIVVTPSDYKLNNEPTLVTKMLEMGVDTIHLRKPSSSYEDLKKYIEAVPEYFHNRIVTHTHHSLAAKYKLKGIHLTKVHKKNKWRQLFTMQKIKLKGRKVTVSTSFNSLSNMYENENKYSYIFLSPVFDNLRGGFQSAYNEMNLRAAIDKTGYHIVARGGVDINKIEIANEIGLYGLAFYTHIWKSDDPMKKICDVIKRYKELGIKTA